MLQNLTMKDNSKVYAMAISSFYPHYVTRITKHGRTIEELETVICWLTGYDKKGLQQVLDNNTNVETFFAEAPQIHENSSKITGVICGYRIEDIEEELMRKCRYMDKLVDEFAKGRKMEKILRT